MIPSEILNNFLQDPANNFYKGHDIKEPHSVMYMYIARPKSIYNNLPSSQCINKVHTHYNY